MSHTMLRIYEAKASIICNNVNKFSKSLVKKEDLSCLLNEHLCSSDLSKRQTKNAPVSVNLNMYPCFDFP